MRLRRVAVTGMGSVSPFGVGLEVLMDALIEGKSGVRAVPGLEKVAGIKSRVGALVQDVDPGVIPRKYRRSMSRMSIYAYLAAREALAGADLGHEARSRGRMGVVIGSTMGSPSTLQDFFEDFLPGHSVENTRSTTFFRITGNSCASNVSQALEINGRILALAAACATGCQAVGYGYEMIALGKQDFALCGGADEFHPLTTATFDIMNAASFKHNSAPEKTPRPFDRDRDGVVCAEGSGIILLEDLESALKRGTPVLAEVAGFATVSSSANPAAPDTAAMERCMLEALEDAGIEPGEVDYINAHATATPQGDIAEGQAIERIFGDRVPVSSLKGHLGHAMAASGSLEVAASIEMMNRRCLISTLNLDHIDGSCGKIRHVREFEEREVKTVMKNSFAFGGINSTLILRGYTND